LCRAERVTDWHFEDEECWVTDCMVCRTPMIVWRPHGFPHPEPQRPLLPPPERIGAERYPDGFWIDPERRRIPDHWHAHARPADGFFDPASDLYGRFGGSASSSGRPSRSGVGGVHSRYRSTRMASRPRSTRSDRRTRPASRG